VKTQFGKVIRESEICVLCGKRKATTKEHIPPQGLFIALPGEYLAVPACEECNASMKLDDEYLCQVMSAPSHSKSGIEVWREKVAPKLPLCPKTRAGLRNGLSVDNLNVQLFGEVCLPTLRIDRNRASTSLRKLVAGLYWFHTREMLEPGIQLDVFFLNVAELPEHFADTEKMAIFKEDHSGSL